MSTVPLFPAHDFWHYWAAGRLVLEGKNPYDQVALHQLLGSMGWVSGDPLIGSPPWALWLYSLFALLPFEIAKSIWLLFIILGGAIFIIWQTRNFSKYETILLIFTVPSLLFGNVLWGQLNVFIAVGIMVAITIKQKHPFLSGLALSLCFLKPHLFFPLYGYMTRLFFKKECPSLRLLLIGAIIGLSAQCVATLLIAPNSFIAYVSEVIRSSTISRDFPSPTLAQLLQSQAIGYLLLATGFVSGFIIAGRKSFCEGLPAIFTLGIATSPYAWSHCFVFIASQFLVAGHWLKRHFSLAIPIILLLTVCQYFLLLNPRYDYIFAIVPWLLLLVGYKTQQACREKKPNQLLH